MSTIVDDTIGNADRKRKNSEYAPNATIIKNILRLTGLSERDTMSIEQMELYLNEERMNKLSDGLRLEHPSQHSICMKWCTPENVAGLLNNEAEKRRKLNNTPNVTMGTVRYMVDQVFPIVLQPNEFLQASAEFQKGELPDLVGERHLVSPIDAAERIVKLGFDGLRDKGLTFQIGKNAQALDERLHRRYFSKEFLTKVANKIYLETAATEKKKVGRKQGNNPNLLTQTSKAFTRSIGNSQKCIQANNTILAQKMNKLAQLTVGNDMSSGMCTDFDTDLPGGNLLIPGHSSESETIATLDALEVDLSSHLRECKRIIQNIADLEHRSGERPAVIATLTWGVPGSGPNGYFDLAYDPEQPPSPRFQKHLRMVADILGNVPRPPST